MNKNKNVEKLIDNIVRDAAQKIAPQKVILFGSYAYGKPNKDSDVDLLFIKNTKLSGLKRYKLVADHIEHLLPLDILIKTPQEIERRLDMGDPFYGEIMENGKIIYEETK